MKKLKLTWIIKILQDINLFLHFNQKNKGTTLFLLRQFQEIVIPIFLFLVKTRILIVKQIVKYNATSTVLIFVRFQQRHFNFIILE